MQPATTNDVSASTRFKVWLSTVTLCTRVVVGVCCGVYLVEAVLLGTVLHSVVCLRPALFLHLPAGLTEVYRIYTAPLFHGGLLHVLMNMMALFVMSIMLEKKMGTMNYAWVLLMLTTVGGVLHVVITLLLEFLNVYHSMWSCAVGFSGVIFGLLVIETSISNDLERSVFGLFTVSAKLYPWILLVLMQFLLPNVSFVGHLSGILAGYLFCYGPLQNLLLPAWLVSKLQDCPPVCWIKSWDSYISDPNFKTGIPPCSICEGLSSLVTRVKSAVTSRGTTAPAAVSTV
eukprot:TRINITY_DN5242_c0_g1_i2.p1 TRINITY_DN5242_c0_g1~~TRINITY_DN5242_c0_g1_i2.p1  ORF type:complete len:287 (+),score=60.36 TRINITY_DN5242_c0_g1_i2:29-889(+)